MNWFFLLLLLASQPVAAAAPIVDKITVQDGSVLKGEIKRIENDELILDTDYADDVVIDVTYIVAIDSIQHYSIRLISGEIISGYLEVSNGKIILRETLPPAEASEPPEIPREIELADTASESEIPEEAELAGTSSEAAFITPDIELEPVVEALPPSAQDQPQPTPAEDLPSDEMRVKPAQPTDTKPLKTQVAEVGVPTREFSFDEVDWIREKPTYLRYEAELNVGAQLARGNTDTTDMHFDARFEPSFGWNTFRILGEYDKKTADGDTTTNRWKGTLVYERDFYRRWFVGATNLYESDRQRDLDLRVVAAAGIGYRFFDEDPTHLSVLPALAYVNENFQNDAEDTQYAAFRLQIDFTRDLYKDDISVFHNSMYLNNLQDLGDINVETRTGIEFDMAWDLVLSAEFQSDWVNEPAEGAKKLDTRYMLKIGFEFEGDETDWFQ